MTSNTKIDQDATTTIQTNATDAPRIYKGGCFCGAISYQVAGPPLVRAYCHCTICQRINSAAFIHTIHFPGMAFSWTHGASPEAMEPYTVWHKPWKTRWRCKACGNAVASHNSKAGKWSIWGTNVERDEDGKIKWWDELEPTAHIFYGTRMLDVNDELGKWEGYENESVRLA